MKNSIEIETFNFAVKLCKIQENVQKNICPKKIYKLYKHDCLIIRVVLGLIVKNSI